MSGDYTLTTWEPRRFGLRWRVVERTSYPAGLHGVRVKPFESVAEVKFWRHRSAIRWALDQAYGLNTWSRR